ncbi:12694_t:CDS:2, partial [Gigaspora rosea]
GYEIDLNVDGFLKEIMLKNSVSWIPFNELKNIQQDYANKVITVYSAEWVCPHKSGVRIRKVKLDQLTGSVDANINYDESDEDEHNLADSRLFDISDVVHNYELSSVTSSMDNNIQNEESIIE